MGSALGNNLQNVRNEGLFKSYFVTKLEPSVTAFTAAASMRPSESHVWVATIGCSAG
jgi:hypothetical protein